MPRPSKSATTQRGFVVDEAYLKQITDRLVEPEEEIEAWQIDENELRAMTDGEGYFNGQD